MKQSGGSSFTKSPDVTNCLDDDTLIAKTILGISTLQLDMMGKIKKLEENQNTILEETRLERAKHNVIIDALEKHYDKEMGRFMEMVNILVENINRRDQINTLQPSDATRIASQNVAPRTNAVPNIASGVIPSFQGFNVGTPSSFFSNQNIVQHAASNPLQSASGFANPQGVNHQQISNLQQLLQSSQYHLLQQQLAHAQAQQQAAAQAHQFAQTQPVSNALLNAARGMLGNVTLDATSFPTTISTPSSIPSSLKSLMPAAVTSASVASKSNFVTSVPTFKASSQDFTQTNAGLSFKPVTSVSVPGGMSAGGFTSFTTMPSENKVVSAVDKNSTIFQSGLNETSRKAIFSPTMKGTSPHKDLISGKQEDDVEEFVPTAHFEPVVPLPALIDAKTGEEDETVLFKSRAKLYRYVKTSNEYKERGIGDIKILQSSDGKRRIVMRRDQVLKVCANVPLRLGMKVSKKPGTENTCIWACKDYSESSEGTDECFVARFKTPQLADDFIRMFREVGEPSDASVEGSKTNTAIDQQNVSGTTTCSQLKTLLATENFSPVAPSFGGNNISSTKKTNELAEKKVEQGFGDAFKPPIGSWECKSCYTRNKAEANVCPCCGTKKDGTIVSSAFTTSATTNATVTTPSKEKVFSFGITTGLPFPKSADIVTTAENTTSNSVVTFGLPVTSASKITNAVSGAGLPTFSFSPLPGTKTTSSTVSPASTHSFSTASVPSGSKPPATVAEPATTKSLFSFAKPILPVPSTSPAIDSKPSFSFAASAFKAPQESSKGASIFSFKTAEVKPGSSGPAFGASPVFGGKPAVSTMAVSKEAGKSPGNSLFGASAGSSPFSGSVFGGATSGGFAALAAKAQTENSSAKSNSSDRKIIPFQGGNFDATGKSVFSVTSMHEPSDKDDKSGKPSDDAEEFVPTAHFEPVIPLPALVETKTGEEDEKVLFKTRAKLYRYVKQTNEYKERGVGDIKILQNKDNKCRVVMRRDQVLKVCANAPIRPGMKISKKPNTDNACMWACKDYTEDAQGSDECFVVRFKTAQLADEFMSVFHLAVGESMQTTSKGTVDLKKESSSVKSVTPSSSQVVDDSRKASNSSEGNQEEESDEEDNEYEELKNYPVLVCVTDAYPSPMKPNKKLDIKGIYAIGIRHDVNAMEVDVLDASGETKLTHLVCKDDKFISNGPNSFEYITTDDERKNVKVSVTFDIMGNKDEALSHLHKGVNMAAENED